MAIHKSVWNCFGVILSDSQQFLVIHKPLWNHFWDNSWWLILQIDVMMFVCSFNKIVRMNFPMAPVASILNQFSQTRYHLKAENLLFPHIYKSWGFTWGFTLICLNLHENQSFQIMRFSASKCYLVCENRWCHFAKWHRRP